MVHHLGAPTMKALARMLNSDPTTVTRNVQGLSKRRLVSISPGKDLRERKAKLTTRGEAIVLCAWPNWRKAQNDVVASLDRFELPRLRTLLEQVGRRGSKR
jgi:DNA-binding MarR family transcriptional regulator